MDAAEQPAPVLVLGSSSPRRRELLRQVGVAFRVVVVPVDEAVLPGESPADYVRRVARDKAIAVRAEAGDLPVLAADTTVVLDGEILGKPEDRADAARILGRLSDRTHEVYSAVALALPGGAVEGRLSVSRVRFAPMEPGWIARYIETGDPMDKAGAYGVQGRAAEMIAHLEGSFTGVMGLPLYETCELLRLAKVII